MSPKVSIIVPVYNSEKYLHQCIDSLLSQTLSDIELIIINDGSTDSSLEICNYFSNKDSRVNVLSTKNNGVSIARNIGISMAKGSYICFVDSDDSVSDIYCQVLLDRMLKDRTECAAMARHSISTIREGEDLIVDGKSALEKLLKLKFPSSLWAYMYRSDLIKKLRLSEDIFFFEDFEFNCRVLMKANCISICYDDLYQYRLHDSSTNSQGLSLRKISCLDVYEKLKDELEAFGGKEMLKKAFVFRAHFVASLILLASRNCGKEVDFCMDKIQMYSRKLFFSVIFKSDIPLVNRFLIFVSSVNIKIVPLFIRPLYRALNCFLKLTIGAV